MVNKQKLQELLIFIASSPDVRDLGLTKLWKLIYFADVTHLRNYDHSITDSEFIRYEHGPVPSRGERVLKAAIKANEVLTRQQPYGPYQITYVQAMRQADIGVFTTEELKTIESVCQKYGDKTAAYLSELSHLDPAWKYASEHDKLDPELMLYGFEEDPEGL